MDKIRVETGFLILRKGGFLTTRLCGNSEVKPPPLFKVVLDHYVKAIILHESSQASISTIYQIYTHVHIELDET